VIGDPQGKKSSGVGEWFRKKFLKK